MRATGVIVRFLSLLDVAIILVGLLMLVLAHAELRSFARPGDTSRDSWAKLAKIDFIGLYAGWRGQQDGKCYQILSDGKNFKIGSEIRTDTANDIDRLYGNGSKGNRIVAILFFSKDGWYSAWDETRLAAMEKTWDVKVIPVYNFDLSEVENP